MHNKPKNGVFSHLFLGYMQAGNILILQFVARMCHWETFEGSLHWGGGTGFVSHPA